MITNDVVGQHQCWSASMSSRSHNHWPVVSEMINANNYSIIESIIMETIKYSRFDSRPDDLVPEGGALMTAAALLPYP